MSPEAQDVTTNPAPPCVDETEKPSEAIFPPGSSSEAEGTGRKKVVIRDVAVISFHKNASGGVAGFVETWNLAQLLSPSRIVVLGDVTESIAGELICGEVATGLRLTDTSIPAIFCSGDVEQQRDTPIVIDSEEGRLLVASVHMFDGDESGLLHWAEERAGEASESTILIVDGFPGENWDTSSSPMARYVRTGEGIHSPHITVFGGAPRVSWIADSDRKILFLPDVQSFAEEGAVADGYTSGLLWIKLHALLPEAVLLRPGTVLPAAVFDREAQCERDLLRKSLTCSVVSDRDPVAKVCCRNTTSHVMSFRTNWAVSSGQLLVDPKILSFQLEPGEVFKQSFRLRVSGVPTLKFAMPIFAVYTRAYDGLGRPVELTLSVRPHCRIYGVMQQFTTRDDYRPDGAFEEWKGEGWQIGHPSQVVLEKDLWQGPSDVSSMVYVAETPEGALIGLSVQDDDSGERERILGVPVAEILLTPLDGDAEGKVRAIPLKPFSGAEHVSVVPGGWSWRRDGAVLTAEILIPNSCLSSNWPEEFLMDVRLNDVDVEDAGSTSLFLSSSGDMGTFADECAMLTVPDRKSDASRSSVGH